MLFVERSSIGYRRWFCQSANFRRSICAPCCGICQSTIRSCSSDLGFGEDAAVIDIADLYLIVTTDPITLATDHIGRYAIANIFDTIPDTRWYAYSYVRDLPDLCLFEGLR